MNWLWSSVVKTAPTVMKRIATAMMGVVATSARLELLVYQVIFLIWKRRSLTKGAQRVSRKVARSQRFMNRVREATE